MWMEIVVIEKECELFFDSGIDCDWTSLRLYMIVFVWPGGIGAMKEAVFCMDAELFAVIEIRNGVIIIGIIGQNKWLFFALERRIALIFIIMERGLLIDSFPPWRRIALSFIIMVRGLIVIGGFSFCFGRGVLIELGIVILFVRRSMRLTLLVGNIVIVKGLEVLVEVAEG